MVSRRLSAWRSTATCTDTFAGSKDVAGVTRMLAIPRSADAEVETRSSTALRSVDTFTPSHIPRQTTAMRVPDDLPVIYAASRVCVTRRCCADHDRRGEAGCEK